MRDVVFSSLILDYCSKYPKIAQETFSLHVWDNCPPLGLKRSGGALIGQIFNVFFIIFHNVLGNAPNHTETFLQFEVRDAVLVHSEH